MDGDPDRRIEALERIQNETSAKLDQLLEHSLATAAKLAGMDAKLVAVDTRLEAVDTKLVAMDIKLAVVDAKLDAKADAASVAAVSAKLDYKANVADIAKYEPLVKAIADLVIDIRTLRDNARTDYRVLFGATIAATLGLAALMARGFHWL